MGSTNHFEVPTITEASNPCPNVSGYMNNRDPLCWQRLWSDRESTGLLANTLPVGNLIRSTFFMFLHCRDRVPFLFVFFASLKKKKISSQFIPLFFVVFLCVCVFFFFVNDLKIQFKSFLRSILFQSPCPFY